MVEQLDTGVYLARAVFLAALPKGVQGAEAIMMEVDAILPEGERESVLWGQPKGGHPTR